jgi:hypothetical protein
MHGVPSKTSACIPTLRPHNQMCTVMKTFAPMIGHRSGWEILLGQADSPSSPSPARRFEPLSQPRTPRTHLAQKKVRGCGGIRCFSAPAPKSKFLSVPVSGLFLALFAY